MMVWAKANPYSYDGLCDVLRPRAPPENRLNAMPSNGTTCLLMRGHRSRNLAVSIQPSLHLEGPCSMHAFRCPDASPASWPARESSQAGDTCDVRSLEVA